VPPGGKSAELDPNPKWLLFYHETHNSWWWCTTLLKKLIITGKETTSLYGSWSFIVYKNVPLCCILSHRNLISAFTFSQDPFVISFTLTRLLFPPVFPTNFVCISHMPLCVRLLVCFSYNKLKFKGIWDGFAWSDDTPKNFQVFLTWKKTLVHLCCCESWVYFITGMSKLHVCKPTWHSVFPVLICMPKHQFVNGSYGMFSVTIVSYPAYKQV
jgi:hypothetical protein